LFQERFPANPEVKLAFLFNAAYQKNYDSVEVLAQGLLDDQRGTVFWEAIAYEWWGHLDAAQGRLTSARRRWQRAFEITSERGVWGAYLLRMARRAIVERLLLDDPNRALEQLDDALALHPLAELTPLDRPYGHLAFAYAASGRPEQARSLLDEYDATPDADHSEDTEKWADGARGVVALAEDRHDEALAAFLRFDDGNACATCAYPWLARAYDRLGQEDSVRVMYERLVDLPSAALWYDGAHLAQGYVRLAEIYEGQGETEKALEFYGRFVSLWEEADPELQPWVERAREALRRLADEPQPTR
jgi:tetratricopeptide (TPR) repeat protein